MRRPWLVYLLTALVAGAAGVAIAGLPSRGSGDAVVSVPVTTSTTSTTTTTVSTTPASTPASTSASTSAPTTESSTPTTAAPPTTAVLSTTTTTTTTDPSRATTTSSPPPTTVRDDGPSDDPRGDLRIVVANGAGVPGLAGSAADLLRDAGFDDVTAANTGPEPVSVVYHRDGHDAIAEIIIAELGLPERSTGPIGDAPSTDRPDVYDIVVVLGADRQP